MIFFKNKKNIKTLLITISIVKKLVLLFILFWNGSLWSQEKNKPDFTKEYFQRIVEKEKTYLWSILSYSSDEKGYASLSPVDEIEPDLISIKENKNYKLVFTFDDIMYRIALPKYCASISPAAAYIYKIFKERAVCVLETRGSTPYLLLVGENENEILKEIQTKKLADKNIIPSWYDYKVRR